MGQNQAAQSVGTISADGQQWVALPRGYREPTPWTRPMQLASAGLFGLSAISTVILNFAFVNHDSMLRALQAQGTTIPAGSTIDTVVNIAVGFTYGIAVFTAILELVAAVGSYLGWRWMFWAVLVISGIGAIEGLTGLGSFSKLDASPFPLGMVVYSELLNVGSLALFVWLLVGVIKYGPWAARKPVA